MKKADDSPVIKALLLLQSLIQEQIKRHRLCQSINQDLRFIDRHRTLRPTPSTKSKSD